MDDIMFSKATVEWETPQSFYDGLNAEFHFTLDPCATAENAKCKKFYTKDDDGLSKDWTGETVYCNPPYGKEMPKWIKKCSEHASGGVRQLCLSLREQIQKHFMNTFIIKLK